MEFLVTGATGNVGGEVAAALLADGHQVRALVRADRPPVLPAGAVPVVGDLNDPSGLDAALAGVDAAFLLSGYADMPGLLAKTNAAGARRVVLLSGNAASSCDAGNAVSAYMMRSELAVLESGVPWTILRPYAFMSNALRWTDQLKAGDVVREPFADVRAAVIDPFDLAALAASAMTTDEHEGQSYVLSGPEPLLPADRLRIIGEVLGRDLRLEPVSNNEARLTMTAQMPVAYVDAFFNFYVDGALDETQPQPTLTKVLGREPRTFLDWARAHADNFR